MTVDPWVLRRGFSFSTLLLGWGGGKSAGPRVEILKS